MKGNIKIEADMKPRLRSTADYAHGMHFRKLHEKCMTSPIWLVPCQTHFPAECIKVPHKKPIAWDITCSFPAVLESAYHVHCQQCCATWECAQKIKLKITTHTAKLYTIYLQNLGRNDVPDVRSNTHMLLKSPRTCSHSKESKVTQIERFKRNKK